MGEMADQIIEEFKKKGLPLPDHIVAPARRYIGGVDRRGMVADGGGVRVRMSMMDSAPGDSSDERTAEQRVEDRLMHLEKTGVLRHENSQMIVASSRTAGGVLTVDTAISDAQAVRDKAYLDYQRSLSPDGVWGDRSYPKSFEDARAMSDRAYDAYVKGLNERPGQSLKLERFSISMDHTRTR